MPAGNVTVHNVPKLEHVAKLLRHPCSIETDAKETDRGRISVVLGPSFHLCRARAAPASPTVVKVDDGWLAFGGKEMGRRRERRAHSSVCIHQIDVEVANWIACHDGGACALVHYEFCRNADCGGFFSDFVCFCDEPQ